MDSNIILWIGMSVALFVLYWYLLFRLIDHILEKPRVKAIYKLPVCVANTLITILCSAYMDGILTPFIIILILLLLSFAVLYKSTVVENIFCTCACILHVLAINIMISSIFSLVTGYSMDEVLKNKILAIQFLVLVLALVNSAILMVIKFIPFDKVRIINQHREQQWFLVAWMVVNNIYLLYHVSAFHKEVITIALAENQMIASLVVLLGVYIVLFFAIKTVTLLGYQEKNEVLTQEVLHEQQYRNSIMKDAVATYEVNLTKDILLNGFEQYRQELGDMVDSYSDMLSFMTRKMVHSEDVEAFIGYSGSSNLLYEFKQGKSEVVIEYRRLIENGEYRWVRASANLIQDIHTGDLIAYVCVKDINQEKRRQLELQEKAERDPLTGLYNKEITEKLVNEHLMSIQELQISALFIVDVDNFKAINDHLGHLYGDAVLCELGDKLRSIFRSDDIVGRIGGDEFIGYMKYAAPSKIIEERAMEICKAFHIAYSAAQGKEYGISSSVGIAIFPRHGHCFEDLYHAADIALYKAKNAGKNKYQVYDGSAFTGYESTRTKLQSDEFAFQKGFRQNRIEYIFKILYQSQNPVEAIYAALELVARHFSFERGYIFETSKDGSTTSNTFEWCANGVISQISNLKNLPIEAVATANEHFCKTGIFILKNLNELQSLERAILEQQGIKSMFQFGIFDKNQLLGFIGFDNCRSETLPCEEDIDEIATICNILATFFVKQYTDEASAKDIQLRQDVMNHLNNYIYVVNPNTFEVLYMNEQTSQLMGDMERNTPCYSFFSGKQEQCVDCPIRKLKSQQVQSASGEIYNEKLNRWLESRVSNLRWTDGTIGCLINCTDITKQKEEQQLHIGEIERLVFVDNLTGSRSYNKFIEDAQHILECQQNVSHFIMKLDIDSFKLINKIYGYEKGDQILRCVAQAIKQTTRNENEIFARIANDEFVALFEFEDTSTILAIYHTFLHHFNQLMDDDFSFQCSFPHGIYLVEPGENLNIKDMFEKVNVAHKVAKQDKSLKYALYDETMTNNALRVKEIENKMVGALRNNEFIVYLQPKYHLVSEMVGGAEALVRWKNDNDDLFFPVSFISIFEKNGFIIKLDFYVLWKVCQVMKEWIANGIEPVIVSVNFSRLHLSNRNFVKELCEIVDKVGIDRKYIEIELTETVIYDNMDTFEVVLAEIHEKGFLMSMDDFGSGSSSLAMLKDLSVDVVKMDRSFFVNQRNERRSKIVVGHIIHMLENLGIRIVAEGIEERADIELLRELHCDMVQGYYYAKPMPIERFTELIRIPKKFKGD